MSRSRKDGRGGGGHRGWHTLIDLWSRVYRKKDLRSNKANKALSHRYDRRVSARREISEQMADVGGAIRSRRTAMGLSQQDVARIAGTTQARISEIENVGGNPTLDTLNRVTHALGLELTCAPRS